MPTAAVIDFAAARRRIEAPAQTTETHSIIEIPAARIPATARACRMDTSAAAFELEFTPDATLIERLQVMHSYAELGELLHTTLEESK